MRALYGFVEQYNAFYRRLPTGNIELNGPRNERYIHAWERTAVSFMCT